MASQVLSGASNPSYRNNTGQNVRVVINFMEGTRFEPAQFGQSQFFGQVVSRPAVPSTITISWAGVSVDSASSEGTIAIGRNLAYSQLFRDTASGGTQRVFTGLQRDSRGDVVFTDRGAVEVFQAVGVNNSVSLTSIANNASGFVDALPTELMLAPGQTFSAICGVHNIVVIPELG
jgi:hypothetical protein